MKHWHKEKFDISYLKITSCFCRRGGRVVEGARLERMRP